MSEHPTTSHDAQLRDEREQVFYHHRRPVRSWRLVTLLVICPLLGFFPTMAFVDGLKAGEIGSMPFIAGTIFAVPFALLTVFCATTLIRGGVLHYSFTSSGIRWGRSFFSWSQIGFFGPGPSSDSEYVVLSLYGTRFDPNSCLQISVTPDSTHRLRWTEYQHLVNELTPYLAAQYPGVQIGC